MITAKRPCFFFDRDGIVNRSPGPGHYVTSWEGFRLIPAFGECLRAVRKAGFQAVVVTNQRAVARKLMNLADVEDIHRRLKEKLGREYGVTLLDIACCPHGIDECSCRKPKPGMILAMARKHNLDLSRSWMVGDSETDVEAGKRAGCKTILVGRKRSRVKPDIRVASMRALRRKLTRIFHKSL